MLLFKFISIGVAGKKKKKKAAESLWADSGSLSPITGSVTKGRRAVVCVSPEKPCCVSTDLCLHIGDKVLLWRDDERQASTRDNIFVWGTARSYRTAEISKTLFGIFVQTCSLELNKIKRPHAELKRYLDLILLFWKHNRIKKTPQGQGYFLAFMIFCL